MYVVRILKKSNKQLVDVQRMAARSMWWNNFEVANNLIGINTVVLSNATKNY